jgi:hypothetical protein
VSLFVTSFTRDQETRSIHLPGIPAPEGASDDSFEDEV